MARLDYAMPLAAVTAAVIDTETTGLDATVARIVEIGVVRLTRGVLEDERVAARINPGAPIPESARAVHGIDDAAVAGAPRFAEAWSAMRVAVGDGLWIGHAIGFDLAVLTRECARCGVAFSPPPALDTRLLAQIANPGLPGYSLDMLAAWLDVEAGPRHSALGDALTTARVFAGLSIRLRDVGVRTVGEAMRASSRLTQALDQQARAGWADVALPPASPREAARIDSFAYRCRAGDVASRPGRFAQQDDTLQSALRRLVDERVSSLFVSRTGEPDAPSACGVVTERDVLRAYATHGAEAGGLTLGALANHPVECVHEGAFLYAAAARMSRRKIRHLGVVDDSGRIVGALSARDLLRSRTSDAFALGDELEAAQDGRALAAAWAHLPGIVGGLLADGMEGRDLAQVVSQEILTLTARAAAIAQAETTARSGPAPGPCAVLVLGSAGRGESLLALDQDNALIFAPDGSHPEPDAWFAAMASRMTELLHEAGVPVCKGGVMARNALWRGSRDQWRERIAGWVERSRPQDLLNVDAFFDLRGAHGDLALAAAVREEAFDAARGRYAFAKLLVEATGPAESAFGLFGRLRAAEGRIDLKKAGLFRIVCAARALAIRHHILAPSTRDRLAAMRRLGLGGDADLERLIDAQGLFLTLIVRQQTLDIAVGVPPSNAVEIARLSRLERERLTEALQSLEALETLVRDLLFAA